MSKHNRQQAQARTVATPIRDATADSVVVDECAEMSASEAQEEVDPKPEVRPGYMPPPPPVQKRTCAVCLTEMPMRTPSQSWGVVSEERCSKCGSASYNIET